MKKTIISVISICIFSIIKMDSQPLRLNEMLIGTWEYSNDNSKQHFVECPDILILKQNHNYLVLNECYGDYIDNNPIVESGNWKLNGKQISLKRTFLINYFFLGNNTKSVTLKVVRVTSDRLYILFKGRTEIYERKKSVGLSIPTTS